MKRTWYDSLTNSLEEEIDVVISNGYEIVSVVVLEYDNRDLFIMRPLKAVILFKSKEQ